MIEHKMMWAGYCLQKEANSIKGGGNREIRFHALFVLLEHPQYGHILFDTGYGSCFYEATEVFPYSVYARVTPVFINEEDTAKSQLLKLGIKPEDVSYIIISHFHADHIGGLRDFPEAKFVCLESAYQAINKRTGIMALREGFLPKLLPDDFSDRVMFLREKTFSDEFSPFTYYYDVFGDKSILAFDLSGHASGQIGILSGKRFFVADACYHSDAYRKMLPPPLMVRMLLGSNREYLRMLSILHAFYQNHPDIEIIPSHCNEIVRKYA